MVNYAGYNPPSLFRLGLALKRVVHNPEMAGFEYGNSYPICVFYVKSILKFKMINAVLDLPSGNALQWTGSALNGVCCCVVSEMIENELKSRKCVIYL